MKSHEGPDPGIWAAMSAQEMDHLYYIYMQKNAHGRTRGRPFSFDGANSKSATMAAGLIRSPPSFNTCFHYIVNKY